MTNPVKEPTVLTEAEIHEMMAFASKAGASELTLKVGAHVVAIVDHDTIRLTPRALTEADVDAAFEFIIGGSGRALAKAKPLNRAFELHLSRDEAHKFDVIASADTLQLRVRESAAIAA